MEDHPAWRLSLVLPAFNEEAGIAQAVAEADEALGRFCSDHEVIVVNDGSRDATAMLLDELARARPRVRVLTHAANRGYGAALRTGFEAARLERIGFTDADGQFDLTDLTLLLRETDDVAVAVGRRVNRQDSRLRCFLSRGYNLLARVFFGTTVHDLDCALKVFRREALAKILPQTSGFFVNTEMLTRARQQGLAMAEVDVCHRPRRGGRSKVSLLDVPRTLQTLLPFWWSNVLFPTSDDNRPVRRAERGMLPSSILAGLLLVVVAACLFLGRLGSPLLEPQESRYAEIPRQMLAVGSWLIPVLHGEPYLDKPPLFYWLVGGFYRLLGIHDWAARLVPGLAGIATVLITYLWGRRTLGERPGFLGALLLCLSAHFVYYGRMLTFDGLLALAATAGWAAAHLATLRLRLAWRWWLASAAACALGLMTKGPVAMVLLAGPVLLLQVLDRRAARIGAAGWLAWLGVSLGLAAPWYLAVAQRQPGFLGDFFWRHHVVRFLAPFDHQEPAWFFVPGLLMGLLPWTLLLPGFIGYLARRSGRAGRRRPAALGFFLLAFLCGFGFFSLSGCKRPVYIVPVWPPLALALGCYLDRRIPGSNWKALWQRGSPLAGKLAVTALAIGGAVAAVAGAAGMLKPGQAASLVSVACLTTAVVAFRRRSISWGTGMALTFAILCLGVQHLQPAYNRRFALRTSLHNHARLAEDARVPILCYPQRWDSISFYLSRADVKVYGHDELGRLRAELRARPEALLLVKMKSPEMLRDFVGSLPESVEYVPDRNLGAVAVGWVRQRGLPGASLMAQR